MTKEEGEALAVQLVAEGYVRAKLPPMWAGSRCRKLGGRYEPTAEVKDGEGKFLRMGHEAWMPGWYSALEGEDFAVSYPILDQVQTTLSDLGPKDALAIAQALVEAAKL